MTTHRDVEKEKEKEKTHKQEYISHLSKPPIPQPNGPK
jgi:hypothetical protein